MTARRVGTIAMLCALGLADVAGAEDPASPASGPALASNFLPAPDTASDASLGEAAPEAAPDSGHSLPYALDLAPSDSSDLWQRIRNGFALQNLEHPLVQESEAWYANRPDYFHRMTERSRRYLYHIVEEVERRGMPMEIALLPMIESAYNPAAYSRSHAAGIWQFIPSTGKLYGLKQNWWYDGRRDVVAATTAALDYLQYLHGLFGDWELALAAYNWGEGALARAQLKNRAQGLPIDFQNLALPPETRNYVPKLVAVKNIIGNPAQFGLELESVPNRPYFGAVTLTRHIDMKLAAQLAEIPLDEFTALNPAHSRPVIHAKDAETLLLPEDKVETFLANLEDYDKPLSIWQTYTVKRGERLGRIAPRFGISLTQLQHVNGISPRTRVSSGHTLLVPAHRSVAQPDLSAGNFVETAAPASSRRAAHTVRKGKPAAHAAARKRTHYTVRKGDTFFGIAQRFKVAVADLQRWNNLSGKPLKAGARVTLYLAKNG